MLKIERQRNTTTKTNDLLASSNPNESLIAPIKFSHVPKSSSLEEIRPSVVSENFPLDLRLKGNTSKYEKLVTDILSKYKQSGEDIT